MPSPARTPEEYGVEPTRYDEMIPGCFDPRARLADMDIDGVWGAINSPSFPRFAGTVFLDGNDKDLALLCVQAWNDFCIEEWCAAAPDRFIPMTLLPLWDVEASVREIARTAAKGSKCVGFPENPSPLGLPSFHTDHWDPVFAAAVEHDMPLTMHFGTSGQPPMTAPEAPFAVVIALFGCNSMATLVDLVFSPYYTNIPVSRLAYPRAALNGFPTCSNAWTEPGSVIGTTKTSISTCVHLICFVSTSTAALLTTSSA